MKAPRSGCPISQGLELFGDKWTLLIIRDVIFAKKRHFNEFLDGEEGISSSVLAERLNMLVERSILVRSDAPDHKQKAIYSLTQQGVDLLPVLIQIGIWSRKYLPVGEEQARHAEEHVAGGPALWDRMLAELASMHLDKS